MSHQPVLVVQDVHKQFTHPAAITLLRGVSLSVLPGESVAIMGRSGEGKSTFLHIIGTLETPCQGSIWIAGQKVANSNSNAIRNKQLGFVFQAFHLLEDYTALENVLMPARIARKSTARGSEAYERGCQSLEKVGLGARQHFNTKLLSGGERQRVGIARALANDPALLLADEPSGNLDRNNSQKIQEILISCARDRGKALVLVTHDVELAKACDRCYALRDGLLEEI